MGKSGALRAGDVLAIANLIGECRELGDDPYAWRRRLMEGLSTLVDAEGGHAGELAGVRSSDLRSLGLARWDVPGLPSPTEIDEEIVVFLSEPGRRGSQVAYHAATATREGACLGRGDFLDERDWRAMPDSFLVRELFALDHRMWCFRPIPGCGPLEQAGVILVRVDGRRDFAPRDRVVVGLAFEQLAPLVGGPLARFGEPSPLGLPPRSRAVLACLLEGDGDKQVGRRLGMAPATVNAHTRAIYRHFGVRGRAELMARWIRRGWGRSPAGRISDDWRRVCSRSGPS